MASLTCFGNVDSSKAIKNLIALIVVSRPPHNISVCIGPPVNILFSVEYNWGIQLISLATDRFCRPSLDDDAMWVDVLHNSHYDDCECVQVTAAERRCVRRRQQSVTHYRRQVACVRLSVVLRRLPQSPFTAPRLCIAFTSQRLQLVIRRGHHARLPSADFCLTGTVFFCLATQR